MLSYEDYPANVVKRYFKCPSCASQKLKWNTTLLYSDPPLYPHTCMDCGREVNLPCKQGDVVVFNVCRIEGVENNCGCKDAKTS